MATLSVAAITVAVVVVNVVVDVVVVHLWQHFNGLLAVTNANQAWPNGLV